MNQAKTEELALLGGPKCVTVNPKEHWPVPIDHIKARVCQLIDEGIFWEAGTGVSLELERRLASYIGAKYCLTQNNGTSALWAAYYALGVGAGDEVLHPAYTFIASIAPAVHLGARPVFCEIDPKTLTIDPADMERRITARTKAISIVHMHGNVCDMDAIMAVAGRYNLAVIEDCSHSAGGEWDGWKLGSIGSVGCFSMQGGPLDGKPLPAGEGGFITTSRRDLFERMLFFAHLNRAGLADSFADPLYREMAPTNSGLKFRSHPWPMAMALIMLDTLDERNHGRRHYRDKLRGGLAGLPAVSLTHDHPKATPSGFYGGMQFIYKPEELGGLSLPWFVKALQAEGVAVYRSNHGLTHRLRLFAKGFDLYGRGGPLTGDYPGYPEGSLPVTEEIHARIFGMPTFIKEPLGYPEQVIRAFKKVISLYDRLLWVEKSTSARSAKVMAKTMTH
jgi:perosamine synthetase